MKTFVKLVLSVVLGCCAVHGANIDPVLDENIVARTILAEARSEGSNGMYAVACVIQERAIERHMSPAKICLQPKQFSCWNKATDADKKVKSLKRSWQSDYAKQLAKQMVAGTDLDRSFVGNANHYHTTSVSPSWSSGVQAVAVVGKHKFFKL